MSTNYPKILIVGQVFNTVTGGGITMTNLFYGWNQENLAVVSEDIDNANFSVCNKYYQLGALERRKIFPFNLIRRESAIKSGTICEGIFDNQVKKSDNTSNKYIKQLKYIYIKFLLYSGLIHYKRRFKISKEFLKWIKEFGPEIIYSQLSSIELICLVENLHKLLNIPIAIHLMDDWPKTISNKGPFHLYWQNKIETQFRKLLSESKIFLSISEAMSYEYMTRYGYNFKPFHNPLDLSRWNSKNNKNYELTDTFKILYAGRIGTGIRNCFFDVANAINNLIKKGFRIEFHIQTAIRDAILKDLEKYPFIQINRTVPYNLLPDIFSNSDLLLLPNDFDDNSIAYLKYSMPTKASEYMISGTPILLYSSINNAVTSHAISHNWAYVVHERSIEKLESAILEIYENKELRIKLAKTAKEYAINHFDGNKIRNQFKDCFIEELKENQFH